MKILFIGGNHPRHLYYANKINEKFPFSGAIIQMRETLLPKPDPDLEEHDKQNFLKHFLNREKLEQKYFGDQELPMCKTLKINKDELNSKKSSQFVNENKPDLVLIFGCSLIKDPLYSTLPTDSINLHLGLSPRYRGSATLFWPFYFMEPNFAGSTFHYIISEPDAGNFIHQSTPKLEINDTIHDVGCKTVIQSTDDALKLLKIYKEKKCWKKYSQKGTGKNFLQNDFKPEQLRVIYDIFNDDMVKKYLGGKLKSKTPNLIKQF
jgi:folate-dependent phosphoribosylglycinamide formyltransferase PurN